MRPERLMSGGTGEYAVGTIIPERSPVSLSRARREEFIHALRPLEHSIRDAGHIRYGTGISFPVGPFTRVTFLDTSRRGRYADRLFIHPPKKHPTVIVTERRMRGKRRKRHVIKEAEKLFNRSDSVHIQGRNGKKVIDLFVHRDGTVHH